MTLVALFAMTTGAWADGTWTSGGCTLKLEGTTLTVSKNTSGQMADYTYYYERGWNNDASSVTSLVIEEGVTYLGKNAFGLFTKITEVTIPSTVTSIGQYAIQQCYDLKTVTVKAASCTLGFRAFDLNSKMEHIYVPSDKVTDYKNAAGWSAYESIIEAAPVIPGEMTLNDDKTEAEFLMPSYDATLEYDIVRNLGSNMTAQVGDGTEEQPRYRVQKVEGDYVPADLNAQQVMALFSVTDLLENNKVLTQTTDYTVNIYAIDDQGEPTGDAMTFANFAFEPGHYAVKAVAVDGSYYDGETALSNIFILYEKEITVHPEAIEGLIYSGEPQVLITPAECIGGEMRYSLDGENWSADLPEATDEGTYTVYYKVIADENDDDPFYETVENIVITEMPYEEALAGLYEAIYHASVVLANGQYNRTKQACEELEAVIYQGAQLYIVAHRVGSNVTSKQVVDMIVALRHAEEAFLNSEEVVTGIDNVNANLDDNGTWYDLNGRRLQGKPTTQGVYILNGKKVVVK